MDKLIYLTYPILIFCFFFKAKFFKKGEWNDQAFSLKQTKALQGFLALCIMFHHIGQKTCASWLASSIPRYPGLEIFVPMGFYFVALFFFFSGYGLLKSYKAKPNYLVGFPKKRILPVLFSSYIVILMYYIFRQIQGEGFSLFYLGLYLTQTCLCNVNGWFVVTLPIIYLLFYFAFKCSNSENKGLLFTLIGIFIYCLIGTCIDHNNFFFNGEWWYNSVYGFSVGLLFAKYEEKITTHIKKHFWFYLIFSFVMMMPLYMTSKICSWVFSYYGENFAPDTKVIRRWACLISDNLASFSFMFFMLILNLKLKIGNKILDFMGTITLEFYLVHGLFVELFSYSFVGFLPPLYQFKNAALYVIVVFIISLPISVGIKKLSNMIFSKKKVSQIQVNNG